MAARRHSRNKIALDRLLSKLIRIVAHSRTCTRPLARTRSLARTHTWECLRRRHRQRAATKVTHKFGQINLFFLLRTLQCCDNSPCTAREHQLNTKRIIKHDAHKRVIVIVCGTSLPSRRPFSIADTERVHERLSRAGARSRAIGRSKNSAV